MAQRFDQRVAAFGRTVEACDWTSTATQELRFEVLTAIGPIEGRSVLDVGCGLGDLLRYLERNGSAPSAYAGIDISPRMVAEARRSNPRGSFRVANVLDPDVLSADFVLASGIFSYLGPDGAAVVQPVVRRMFELCGTALAWNSLSTWADRPVPEDELRLDPCDALRLSREISTNVILRHDYHPGDFTVYMFRDRQP